MFFITCLCFLFPVTSINGKVVVKWRGVPNGVESARMSKDNNISIECLPG